MASIAPASPESIALTGGHVALDLVNTVSWRLDPSRRRENLGTPADLLVWAQRAIAPTAGETAALRRLTIDPGVGERVLAEVCALRELLHDHLTATLADRRHPPPIETDSALHRRFVAAIAAGRLDGSPARWITQDDHLLHHRLCLQALELLQTMDADRLHRCGDEACGWLFLDATRNHSRRWCSSSECGNRNRGRRHYAQRPTT